MDVRTWCCSKRHFSSGCICWTAWAFVIDSWMNEMLAASEDTIALSVWTEPVPSFLTHHTVENITERSTELFRLDPGWFLIIKHSLALAGDRFSSEFWTSQTVLIKEKLLLMDRDQWNCCIKLDSISIILPKNWCFSHPLKETHVPGRGQGFFLFNGEFSF